MSFLKYFREEVKVIRDRDPAIHSDFEALLYSSFWAVYWYRKAHNLYLKKHYFLARLLSQHAARRTGIEIHPGAEIGEGFFIDHGSGVIIGETTIIGKNVTLFQGVTLGGTGKEQGKRHPTIGDNVMISAGAKVLGSFKIGNNSKIGAGSVVLKEVPENSTVVGVPGRVVKQEGVHIPSAELNQIDLPDPVKDDLTQLKHADSELTNHILELEQKVRELERELEERKEQ
ncbi:MAG: serine O-acetyltransferase [Lachnospiraceae bacterium]|nr:serine O-acetyltransferase [Lachnospiraceae bacterium]